MCGDARSCFSSIKPSNGALVKATDHLLVHPASFPQVRLQTQPKAKPGETLLYRGTFDCFKKTLAKEVRTPAVAPGIINHMRFLPYVSPPSL